MQAYKWIEVTNSLKTPIRQAPKGENRARTSELKAFGKQRNTVYGLLQEMKEGKLIEVMNTVQRLIRQVSTVWNLIRMPPPKDPCDNRKIHRQ
jgi:hypothetical protein